MLVAKRLTINYVNSSVLDCSLPLKIESGPVASRYAMALKRAAPVSRSTSFSHGIKVRHDRLKKRPAATKTKQSVVSLKTPKQEVPTPFPGFSRPSAADVRSLHTKLAQVFGDRGRFEGRRHGDILGTVVGTILSQNTTNTNSHMAFLRSEPLRSPLGTPPKVFPL